MMVKLGIWRANDPVTGCPEPQTKVNIVEGDGELLVESPDRLENLTANHHASSRHGGVVAHRSGDPELMVCATWKTREWMPRNTAQSKNDPDMLDAIIGKEQFCSYRSDLTLLSEFEHR